jgi:enterochelin esterase-like enzyme
MVSNVIAFVVGSILVLVPGYLFIETLVRGRFEASGYAIDWKTNPVGMIITLLSMSFCPVVILGSVAMMLQSPAKLPVPPIGFDIRREGIEHGNVETIDYESKIAGEKRAMRVYTPPGFSLDRKYPVLYLLHGAISDETTWTTKGAADTILDNLIADKKAVPMIVVMPNGNLFESRPEAKGTAIERDALAAELLDEIIPTVERQYPVLAGREHRALAGVSAGANQAINIWLSSPDTFTYLGVLIGGLHDRASAEIAYRDTLKRLGVKSSLKRLWVSNGKNDVTYSRCRDALELFDKYKIPYTYLEGDLVHGWESAKNNLFVFIPNLFRDAH